MVAVPADLPDQLDLVAVVRIHNCCAPWELITAAYSCIIFLLEFRFFPAAVLRRSLRS
jgi:hypothetical protein